MVAVRTPGRTKDIDMEMDRPMETDLDPDGWVACPGCDGLAPRPVLKVGERAVCRRCGGTLLERKRHSVDRTLAVAITGLLLIVPAVHLPIMGIAAQGRMTAATLLGSIRLLIDGHQYFVATCVVVFTVAIPVVRLLSIVYVLLRIRLHAADRRLPHLFRLYNELEAWAMLHVFMLGIVVAVYKLRADAELAFGPGLVAFVLLLVCATLTSRTLDEQVIWEELEHGHAPDDR